MDYNATFGIDITSPELVTSDRAQGANTLKVLTDTFEKLLSFGLFNEKSIADALVTLTQEHADVEITALTEDEVEERRQQAIEQAKAAQAAQAGKESAEMEEKSQDEPEQDDEDDEDDED